MKKLSALVISIMLIFSFFITSVKPSYAVALSGSLCPENVASGMNFNPLCALTPGGNVISNILNLVFVIAVLAALVFLIYGGIKWITSGGDKSSVESARNMIVAALVGLVISFLAYFIIQIIFNLFGLDFNRGNFWADFNLFK